MQTSLRVLVADQDSQAREFIAGVLAECGWETGHAESAAEVITLLREREWSAIFCDASLGGADGLGLLRWCREHLPELKVVLTTNQGSAAGALDATALGAFEYLLKPHNTDELQTVLEQLHKHFLTRGKIVAIRTEEDSEATDELLGRSPAFIAVMKQVGRLAPTNLPVLLTGETGTGKEVLAAALHRRSHRAGRPFVAVNCGALSAELIESELFGHVRGAFTGADRDRMGLLEEADGGTVFLDEITETNTNFQVKLLRALQEGEIRRVGSNQTKRIDVRVIAASNRNVESEVEAGGFRKDLFYRLNAVSIALPPLRERPEDIYLLAANFARRAGSPNQAIGFSTEALELLNRYPWPGNIRELENSIVRAAAMCDGTIRDSDLPERIRFYQIDSLFPGCSTVAPLNQSSWPKLSDLEGRYVAQVLAYTNGNKQAAAQLLHIDRKTLDRMIKRHEISLPRAPRRLRAA